MNKIFTQKKYIRIVGFVEYSISILDTILVLEVEQKEICNSLGMPAPCGCPAEFVVARCQIPQQFSLKTKRAKIILVLIWNHAFGALIFWESNSG